MRARLSVRALAHSSSRLSSEAMAPVTARTPRGTASAQYRCLSTPRSRLGRARTAALQIRAPGAPRDPPGYPLPVPCGRSFRIALVVERFEPRGGGVEGVAWNVAHGLAAAGDEVRVLARSAAAPASERVRVERVAAPRFW